jgi:FdhD protein
MPSDTIVNVLRVRDGTANLDRDFVVVEAPLEIRLASTPFATIMRTPGHDRELAAGFLFSERVLQSPADLGALAHCTDPDAADADNVVVATLTGPSAAALDDVLSVRRAVVANSACGVCGRVSIESLLSHCAPLEPLDDIPGDVIVALPTALRARQSMFDRTGGLHAAGLFTLDGTLVDCAEDIGRHNAVDKVVGRLVLAEALPASKTVLCVSGRTSFEIVQKAWLAGIGCVASVSAPSSLAIDLATTARITLIGFVRGGSYNVYTTGRS